MKNKRNKNYYFKLHNSASNANAPKNKPAAH